MAAVFNSPMSAIDLEHSLRIGLFRRSAGNTVGNFQRTFTALFLYAMPLDDEGLSNVWKINVVVEFRGGPDFSGFDSSVIRRRLLDELRIFPIPKIELQILSYERKCQGQFSPSQGRGKIIGAGDI